MCWIGILGGHIYGPYWFVDDAGRSISVTSEVYLKMLQEKMWPDLQTRRDLRRVWFMQDGAPVHTTPNVLNWLNDRFHGQVISNKSSVVWPPQSPDLNPCDFWFWGYAEFIVWKECPMSLQSLVDTVEVFSTVLEKDDILKATGSINRRIEKCLEMEGHHFQQLLK